MYITAAIAICHFGKDWPITLEIRYKLNFFIQDIIMPLFEMFFFIEAIWAVIDI